MQKLLKLARQRLFCGKRLGEVKNRLENGKFFGIILKKDHLKKFQAKITSFLGKYLKKVIRNLAYREVLFYKKGPGCNHRLRSLASPQSHSREPPMPIE